MKIAFFLFVFFVCEIVYSQVPGNSSTFKNDHEGAPFDITITQDPAGDFVAIQLKGLNRENMDINLYDKDGKLVKQTILYQGSTIAYFDTRTLYSGEYKMWLKRGVDSL